MIWILWVLVFADGAWRAWELEYTSVEACEEVKQVISYRREHILMAVCRSEYKGERGSTQ